MAKSYKVKLLTLQAGPEGVKKPGTIITCDEKQVKMYEKTGCGKMVEELNDQGGKSKKETGKE